MPNHIAGKAGGGLSTLVLLFFLTAHSATIPKVPVGHPRVYLQASDIPAIKAKLSLPEFAHNLKRIQDNPKPFTKAFDYVINGNQAAGQAAILEGLADLKACDDARSPFNAFHLGTCIYDWCYPLLTTSQKNEYIAEFIRIADAHRPFYPAKKQYNVVVGHNTEGWVQSGQLPAGVAIYDENQVMYDSAAAVFFEGFVPARDFLYPAGFHHQGTSYAGTRLQHDLFAAWLFRRMGVGHVYKPELQSMCRQFIRTMRPDSMHLKMGDEFDARGRGWSRINPVLLGACYFDDPFLVFARDSIYTGGYWPYADVFEILFRSPGLKAKRFDFMPQTIFHPHPIGTMIARTGWKFGYDSPNAIVHMKIGNYYFGNHQHKDFGSFQIYYRGALAIKSGHYEKYGTDHWGNYYRQTIGSNCLLIYDPGETMARGNVNDGGQRWPNKGDDHPKNLGVLLDSSKGYKMGEVTSRGFGPDTLAPDYSFICGDISRAYASPKAEVVERNMVTIRTRDPKYPATIVVYDRVKSKNASFKKTWLCHFINQPQVSGLTFSVRRTEPHRSGNPASGKYHGRLVNQCLLPLNPAITVIGGPGKEFWIEGSGKNHVLEPLDPGKYTPEELGYEVGAWRVEISPSSQALEDEFLNVLSVMDADVSGHPVAKEIDQPNMTAVQVLDWVVAFCHGNSVTSYTLAAPGSDSLKFLILGMKAGDWTVFRNNVPMVSLKASASGHSLFWRGRGGNYSIKAGKLAIKSLPRGDCQPAFSLRLASSPYLLPWDLSLSEGSFPSVRASFFDLQGRWIWRSGSMGQATKRNRPDPLGSGLYFLRIRTPETSHSARILYIR